MKNKGFTLVELLATLVILSIIMLVAVPSTSSVLDKNKKASIISDAKRLVALVESEIRNNDNVEIGSNQVMIFPFADIEDGSFEKDPDSKPYSAANSYVAVHKNTEYESDGTTIKSYKYDYYVQLIGEKRGISLAESRTLTQESVVTSTSIDISDKNTKIKNTLEEAGKVVNNFLTYTS